ncbi:hypothetical protein BDQ12DRAFT_686883 [Crucibulum laeve]|uniref:E3 ubiquitin-protein ligase PEP5 n=1 Tax=Crucibulum laeve TaxID=68775 RepID=A0A5C3LUJ0_9AGAR|nr:hypothetical protein BDQ12DRAFT_686883 [Crucibulum laeve]
MASNSTGLTPNGSAAAASASSAPPWRQFSFFDVKPVKDAQDLDSPPDVFKATPEISTVVSSSVGVLVADIHGSVHLLNRDFESINSWIAHVGGRVTHMVERLGVLVTLGEEDTVRPPLIKIWDMHHNDKKTGAPVLLRSTKIQLSNRPHPVTTLAASANLSHLAIGLADGTVLLYRHLDQSLSTSNSLTALPKPRTAHESPTEPITGLGFREPTEETPNLYLFIVTTNRVLCYQASGRGSGSNTVVDEIGASLGCAAMDWKGRGVVVAREEAIYVCGTEGRGACYAYEGNKSSVHTHLNYLVIVSPPFVASASAASATVRNFVARSANPTDSDITKVTVFDLENKFVAYSGTFTEGVREIVSQWGQIYVLTMDGQLLSLQEKSTQEKLDTLYRKALYPLALNLAKTQDLDEASVADIHKQYGDHLYAKGDDYDAAMAQFIQTIGHLQPSYVIRKFLDAQRIHNLVTYLQELHSLGLANADHTTLLLNTYTKLKDVQRLDSFIKTESRKDSEELPFDLDTAIRVCRQAGYFEHAGYLAKKYERHEDYLRIQIEDAGKYSEALAYLRKLGPEAAESNLARYGRAMLEHLPEETTQLLIDLCTSSGPLVSEPEETSPATVKVASVTPSYLSYLAINRAPASIGAPTVLSSDTATPPSPSIKTVKPDSHSHSRGDSVNEVSRSGSGASTPPATASAIKPPPPPPAPKLLSPRLYFAHFVDHMEQFVVFLETVAQRRWKQSVDDRAPGQIGTWGKGREGAEIDEEEDRKDQVAVWNTLLELYLTLPTPRMLGTKEKGLPAKLSEKKSIFDQSVMRDKAMRVLHSGNIPYDPTHALILCSTHGFTRGLVLLWEKSGMYEDVLRFWMDRDKAGDATASSKVIEALMHYGPTGHPHLYPLVLRFLTSTPELLGKHEDDLKGILEHIDEEGIMPPLGVIQVLSRNGVASVGLVKEWLMGRIKAAKEEIQSDKELTNSYRLETEAKLKEVTELADTSRPKVFHVLRCSRCSGQLDLPTVHFMCSHSYHQRCLPEHETECPKCAQEHAVIREIRNNNFRLADQHDIFISEVQESGFEAVATAFSRGILNTPRTDEVV